MKFINGKLTKNLAGSISNKNDVYLKYSKWMKIVLKRAKEIGEIEIPVSALVIDENDRCIGRGCNDRQKNGNPLGHAELIALRQAAWIKNDWRFNDCTMIVNLEPCTMCSASLIQSRMGKVIYATSDTKRGGLGGSINLATHPSSNHKMTVINGILENESKQLLKNWFKKLRTQKR